MSTTPYTLKSLGDGRGWRLSPRLRDVVAHARSMGLRVVVHRGAGWKPRRWVEIEGKRAVVEFLEADHPWIQAQPERTIGPDGSPEAPEEQ